jgi:protein-disulfide isomerase
MTAFSSRELLTPLAIIVAGLAISGSVLWSGKQFTDVARLAQVPTVQSVAGEPPPTTADIARVSTEGVPFIGAADAPVVMAYWFDYQCPYCRQVEENAMPQLIADYVKTGKLKILFKDFAFLGPDSQTAGLAARAVWEVAPDKFYEWHKAMFDKQDDENAGWGNRDDILALTKTIPGIDAAEVEKLMIDRAAEYQQAIEADGMEGGAQGVSGTPGAVIGRQLIVGAQPYQQFKAAIEAVLRAG